MPTVALVLLGIGSLRGGGGAERFAADLFAHYRGQAEPAFDLRLVTDERSLSYLHEVGKVTAHDGVELLPAPAPATKLWSFARHLMRFIRATPVDVLHVALLSPLYLPALWLIGRRPEEDRPALTVSEVDCALPHVYFDRSRIQGREQLKSYILHRALFGAVPLDGVFTWYRVFAERFSHGVIRGDPVIVPARHYFVDVDRFRPAAEKRNRIIYAARLIPIKQPLFFVRGVRFAIEACPGLAREWRFEMYGKGVLEKAIRAEIARLGLAEVIELSSTPDLGAVLAESRAFVSTHDYENFSSLSLLEAMACGNAILARNLGQTSEFLEHGGNAVLLEKDSPEGLGAAIVRYCTTPELHDRFAARSREIATTVQCASNYISDLDGFWRTVLLRRRGRLCSPATGLANPR